MWSGLRGESKRKEVFKKAFYVISGTGGYSSNDYVSIFYKKYNGYVFYIFKYGCRTIYEKGWNDEWYDVYNWNAVLLVEKPNGEYEIIDDDQFRDYEEITETINKWISKYPEEYFTLSEEEEEEIEFPEWAQSILSQALQEVNKDNIEEVKAKISSTALLTDHKLLKKAYQLLEMKANLKVRGV